MSASQRQLRQFLRGVRLTWCLSAVLAGIVAVAGVLAAYVLLAVVLDNLFVLPPTARWACLAAGAVLGSAALWFALLARMPLRARDERLAAYYEERVPETDNRLINSVQLARMATAAPDGLPAAQMAGSQSEAMAARFVADAVDGLSRLSAWQAFEKARALRWFKWACGPVALLAVYAVLLWSPFSAAVYRLAHPGSTANMASGLRVAVTPGDVTVVEGGDLEVSAVVTGRALGSVALEYQPQASPEPIRVTLRGQDGTFIHTMQNITVPRTYRVVATPDGPRESRLALRSLVGRPAVSPTFQVDTVPPPRVERFRIAYDFPDYTGREDAVEEKDDGDVKGPAGTRVTIQARTNKPLAQAVLCMGEVEVESATQGAGFEVALTLETSGPYHFRLTDDAGFQNADPVVHTMLAVPDKAPEVRIAAPEGDVTIDKDAVLPLVFEAEDDYGLASVSLRARKGEEAEEETLRAFPEVGDARFAEAVDLDLARLELAPGALLQIWVEAVDNRQEEPNRSRSRTLNVRVSADAAPEELDGAESSEDGEERAAPEGEEDGAVMLEEAQPELEDLRDQVEDRLEHFVDMQREIIEQTNNLPARDVDDLTGEEKDAFKDLAAAEDELSEFLEELVSDLSELPEQDFTSPTLADEIIEVLAEVELAEDALELANKEMAISLEQIGLELAEELVHNLPSWLSDVPDNLKWDLEEPLEDYEVPMAELPEELTDLMGELIDEEAAMTEEVEDESSSWADSIDAGAGWATMDGPISNMSATGKTGNLLPNSSEIGGRSGEGRTGRTHGEFVEKTAVGKGGRDTPTRLTPDPFESGVVEDTSTDPMGGATGGGKLAGAAAEGLPGPIPPELQHSMQRLAGMQADIRAKAQRLDFKLKVVNIPAPGLEKAIGIMREVEQDLRDFRYQNVLRQKDVLLTTMRESHDHMQRQVKVRGERPVALSRDTQEEILEALDEDVLPEYEDAVAEYFRALAEAR